MKVSKNIYLHYIPFLFIPNVLFAQINVGEYDFVDCNASRGLTIPFNKDKQGKLIEKKQLKLTTFYNVNEQLIYSYKIIVTENTKLQLSIKHNNVNDNYYTEIYDANQIDFCEKFKTKKLKPKYLSSENRYLINAKKADILFLQVVNTSVGNCGHQLLINDGTNDTLSFTAIHIPCERKIKPLDIAKPLAIKNNEVINKNISLSKKESNKTDLTFLKLNLVNANTLKKISFSPKITDETSGDSVDVYLQKDSSFTFISNKQKKYNIQLNVIGYTPINQTVFFNTNLEKTIALQPLKNGEKITLKNIYFYANTYALKEESNLQLEELLNFLIKNPNQKIQIIGHTNGDTYIKKNNALKAYGEAWTFDGTSKQLSLARANAIKQFLITNNIKSSRVLVKGKGGEEFIIKNPTTIEEATKNMRVEIALI